MSLLEEALYAFALVLMVEGILYALFPDHLRRMIVALLAIPPAQLRTFGLLTAGAGLALIWLLRA